MLVVRSSDAVVSDWQEVVEYGKNTLSVVKPSSEPIEFGAANRKITLSAWRKRFRVSGLDGHSVAAKVP